MFTSWGSATDTGRVRTLNEDALLALPPLFLVADGMGGHAAGDVASRLVVEECTALAGRAVVTIDDLQQCFARAVDRMRDQLGGTVGGTTVAGVGIAVHDGAAYWLVVNIGDSRVYRLGPDGLAQVSVDHSVVQELVEAGEISALDATRHAERHVVTRALATDSSFEPDYWLLPVTRDDRILVCSDGLTDELDDSQVEAVLTASPDAQQAAEALVAAALDAGGRDNVSVVVVDAVALWADPEHDTAAPTGAAPDAWDERRHGVTHPRPRREVAP